MATIPGEIEGTPYDPGVTPHSESPYTPTSNFSETTLEDDQTITVETHYEICDLTGFKQKRGTLRKTWNGWYVRSHGQSWEPRHPLDYVRSRPETSRKGSIREEQTDTFLTTNEVSTDDL